jgi:subtilisin family serine protease
MPMKYKSFFPIIVLFVILAVSPTTVSQPSPITDDSSNHQQEVLVDDGSVAKVSIQFARELSLQEMEYFRSLGIDFGDSIQSLGSVYIAEASTAALSRIREHPLYVQDEPMHERKLCSPRNVSVQETFADSAWFMKDYENYNLTGKDILIADLDTGIQWRHPDFFFADGGNYSWFDANTDWQFQNGTEGIDVNGNYSIEANETLYTIDTNNNSVYEVDIDWIWMDNGTSIGAIDDGDTFFVVDDSNGDGSLNAGEELIALKTPKTKYIVTKNTGGYEVWQRGVNLTTSTFYDTDGHGTGVAGILNGGQLGYRQFVGVAPDADLMAINVFGSNGLTIEEGLIWAEKHGADVILIEVGSWTYEYLDGTSNVEAMIDTLTNSGIPVIVPAGNLAGAKRHALRTGSPYVKQSTRFIASSTYNPSELYLTILSDMPISGIQVNITEPTSTGSITHQMTFGSGYWNWQTAVSTSNITIDAFKSGSSRNTYMLAMDISGTIKQDTYWSVDIIDTQPAHYHFFISDDASGWSGGSEWHPNDGVTDQNTITWPSTADTAISVASYMSRNLWSPGYGQLAPYSSQGNRIDGTSKLSVAAPGGWDVVSPWSNDSAWASWMTGVGSLPLYPMFGGYQLFSGTSAAGPHVAGAAALLLQLNPDIGHLIKDIVEKTAWTDGYTPSPNPYPGDGHLLWGYGKLNISQAIIEATTIPNIVESSQNPGNPEYTDTVVLASNVSCADFVVLHWSHNNWSTIHVLNMTHSGNNWSAAIMPDLTITGASYTASIPAHQYNQSIWYEIIPINGSSIGQPTLAGFYQVDDSVNPVIHSVDSNATATVLSSQYVEVKANVSEAFNASGISNIAIEFTTDNWVSSNVIPMTLSGGLYVGVIAPNPGGLVVKYRVNVMDAAGNQVQSSELSYSTEDATTTTTTTDTSTTTTTDTTPTDTTSPTSRILDFLRENMVLVAVVGVALVILILCFIARRR